MASFVGIVVLVPFSVTQKLYFINWFYFICPWTALISHEESIQGKRSLHTLERLFPFHKILLKVNKAERVISQLESLVTFFLIPKNK